MARNYPVFYDQSLSKPPQNSYKLGIMSSDMTQKQPLLACQALHACRDDVILTQAVTAAFLPASYTQLRGRNGSGKSTFLRHLAGLLPTGSGSILIGGKIATPTEIPQQLSISYLGHDDAMHGDLTGYENFELLTGQSRIALVQSDLYRRPVSTYSAGQRQKLTLHMLDDAHDLWLLDEPSASLDEANLTYLEERIAGYLACGGIVIAATHLPLAQSLITQTITLTPYEAEL